MAPTLTELVLDRAHNAVIWLDERGCVTYWNPSAERIFGIAHDEALGQPVAELIIPERAARRPPGRASRAFWPTGPGRCWIGASR